MFLWADFETSGLDPERDIPLELGLILTEDNLTIKAEQNLLLGWPQTRLIQAMTECNSVVHQMHTDNGLWLELLSARPKTPIEDFESTLLTWAQFGAEVPVIAGFNPGFDLRWLRVWAPKFAALLHYGVFDVSCFRRACTIKYGHAWGPSDRGGKHRGLSDLRDAIAYWRWFRSHIMSPYGKRDALGG